MTADMQTAEVWYETKAFTVGGLGPTPEQVAEFRGEGAEAQARAWFQHKVYDPEIDAVYLYQVNGLEHQLIDTWSLTYDGAVFADYDGEDDEMSYDEFYDMDDEDFSDDDDDEEFDDVEPFDPRSEHPGAA